MALRRTNHVASFQIGAVPVTLAADYRGVVEQYGSLYEHHRLESHPARAVRVTVRRQPMSLWHRRRYDVISGDRLQFEPATRAEVLPYVEWAVNWQVPHVLPEYLQLHASSVQYRGEGVIFPGGSGFGKSTLTMGLLARGWRYFSDEFALIHAESRDLHPFPRALCLKKPSLPLAEKLGVRVHRNAYHIKGGKGLVGFVDPFSLGRDRVAAASPIRWIIFPKYEPGTVPRLTPMSRAEAALEMHRHCFNLLTCHAAGADVLASVVRGATCYRLAAGELSATCDLLESAMGAQALAGAA
jgi:HprK-related kinase A